MLGIKLYRITYSDILDHLNHFYGYANANDCKSTIRYVFKMARGAVTWYLKKQTVIALSFTKAEYITLSEIAREVCWLRTLFQELGSAQALPTKIQGDNEGLITLAKNPQFYK